MDALSSQATVAGYRAALIAAESLTRFFPMLTTAAGTVKPAKVLVLGAGVAGLQAIATARRLGAQVTGYDVRAAVKEQVESLGAKFLELDLEADAEGEGGYAKALAEEQQQRQQDALADAAATFDAAITTALIPGKPAPLLLNAQAVKNMKPGSVIVDLAGEAGGNCELSEPGETVVREDVTIAAPLNLPATMPEHASQLYARNIQALLELISEEGELKIDPEDEIVKGAWSVDLLTELTILILAAFVGFEVISKIPNTLHTPLMSATNAIHGIVVLGGLLVIGQAEGTLNDVILVIAIAFGTINVVGGFLVTDRMLEMFKKKPTPPKEPDD